MSEKESVNYNTVQNTRTTSLFSGIFNNAKSAIGAGALMIPSIIGELGWAIGLSILVFASILTTASLHFLQRLSAHTDLSDYFALGHLALGSTGEILSVISLILFLLGGLVFYIALSAENLISFITYMLPQYKGAWILKTNHVMIITALLIFPLACMRDMRVLAKTSIIGMICMFYVLLWTVFDLFYDWNVTKAAVVSPCVALKFKDFFTICSGILFAFVNHFTMLATVPTLVNPTPKRRKLLTLASGAFVLAFYIVLGLSGYFHFGHKVPLFIQSPNKFSVEWPYRVAQLLIALVLILSFPLLCDPVRGCIEHIIAMASKNKGKSPSAVQNLLTTACIVGVSLTLGIACRKQVDVVLGVFSAFSGALLVFIFPAVFFLRLSGKYTVKPIERVLAYVNIVFGLFLMVFGTYFGIEDMISRF